MNFITVPSSSNCRTTLSTGSPRTALSTLAFVDPLIEGIATELATTHGGPLFTVLVPFVVKHLRANGSDDLVLLDRYRHTLLQCEIEQGLAWHSDLVSFGDDFRSCACGTSNARPDGRTLAATGDSTND